MGATTKNLANVIETYINCRATLKSCNISNKNSNNLYTRYTSKISDIELKEWSFYTDKVNDPSSMFV